MAFAGAEFADSVMRGLDGEDGVVSCCFVESDVTDAPFFATKVTLGVSPLPPALPPEHGQRRGWASCAQPWYCTASAPLWPTWRSGLTRRSALCHSAAGGREGDPRPRRDHGVRGRPRQGHDRGRECSSLLRPHPRNPCVCRSGTSLMPSGAPSKPAALRAAALRGRDARARLTQFCCSCACCAAHGPGGQGRRLHRLSAQLSCDHMPPGSHVATAIANGESLSIKCDFLNWAARVVKDGPPWSPDFCWNQRRVVKM